MKIKGAISPEMLLIQAESRGPFLQWLVKKYGGEFSLKTYCDGEAYAYFPSGREVSFREFIASRIKGPK